MEAGRLFVHTLRDLEHRSTVSDEYTVFMAAALLRKLLLDGRCLVSEVNREHKLKLRYRISDVSPLEKFIYDANPDFWIIEDALDPASPFAFNPYDATLDQFLQRKVVRFQGNWGSVRDVIDQLANVEGAVHYGNATSETRKALRAAATFYGRAGLSGLLSQLRVISRIIVRSLRPLRDAVLEDGAATWASVDSDGSVSLSENGPRGRHG